MSWNILKKDRGISLIEILIVLVMMSFLVAAAYRTFIGQQKAYTVQEQVVDTQQSVRVAMDRMTREIRMAGFGNVSDVLPITANGGPFNNIINPVNNHNAVNQGDDKITIVGAFEQVSILETPAAKGTNTIKIAGNISELSSTGNKRYICIGGLESHIITNIDTSSKTITLNNNLSNEYSGGTAVYKVKAITYRLRWDNDKPSMPVLVREDNTDGGGNSYVVAENIENLQMIYTLSNETESDSPSTPSDIRMVKVTITARTSLADPKYGYRRRELTSNIKVRNLIL